MFEILPEMFIYILFEVFFYSNLRNKVQRLKGLKARDFILGQETNQKLATQHHKLVNNNF